MTGAQERAVGAAGSEVGRFSREHDRTAPFAPPESSSAFGKDSGENASARKSEPLDAPRMGLLLAVATVLAAPYVILCSLVGAPWWDDEGMLMAGFRSLLDGHRMYDEIYSLYGPLYNLVYGFIYGVLRVPLTHDAGRLIAAALWLAYTTGLAAFAWTLTRSASTTAFSYMLVLLWLLPLTQSAGHPAQLCLLLLAAILLLVSAIERVSSSAAWGALGAAVAGLALVKINIGAYVGGPVLYALLRASPANAWMKLAARLSATAMLVMPLAVEAILFDLKWVRIYCLFSTLTIMAALIVSQQPTKLTNLRPTHWAAFVLAGGLTSAAIVGGMMLGGSSAYAIFNAVVLQSAGWIRNWWRPLEVPPYGLAASLASAAAALLWRFAATRPDFRDSRELGLLLLRCAYVTIATAAIVFFDRMLEISIVLPFSWVIMLPPTGVRENSPAARSVAGLIAAMMSLYAFPVEGFQQDAVATVLPVALTLVIARDALIDLRLRGVVGRANPTVAARMVFGAVVIVVLGRTAQVAGAYFSSVPLDLPGARLIRVDRERADDLRWVTAQLSSCVASYSVPGMPSLAFWTGQPLVTRINVNDVLGLISPARQQDIVSDLSRLPDLCIVYNPSILKRFDRGQIATDPPLLRFLRTEFVAKAERNGYIILMRRGDAAKIGERPGGPRVNGTAACDLAASPPPGARGSLRSDVLPDRPFGSLPPREGCNDHPIGFARPRPL
jgi:hypothetical protein